MAIASFPEPLLQVWPENLDVGGLRGDSLAHRAHDRILSKGGLPALAEMRLDIHDRKFVVVQQSGNGHRIHVALKESFLNVLNLSSSTASDNRNIHHR